MKKNQEQYKQELIKKIKEMQDKKAFGVIKVHIQYGEINKINAHITEEIKPENGGINENKRDYETDKI